MLWTMGDTAPGQLGCQFEAQQRAHAVSEKCARARSGQLRPLIGQRGDHRGGAGDQWFCESVFATGILHGSHLDPGQL
jgi:hypothetical protein